MIKDQKSSQDLARKTEVHRKLKRMGRGARKVKPGGGKGPVLVLMLLLLCMGWLCYGLVDGLMMGGLLGRLYCIATGLVTAALAVGLTMTLLWVWGGPLQARRGRSPGPDWLYECKRGSPGTAVHYQTFRQSQNQGLRV